MTLDEMRDGSTVLLEAISGSRAYGLATPESDTDIKGVFALGRDQLYGLTYTEQVNNETNDIAFYEVKRLVELLLRNNPNMLELLAVLEHCIISRHECMDLLKPEYFISRLCEKTFAGYAMTQIRKAQGLNKKILNPMPEQRKSVLDFCYVAVGQKSVPVLEFLYDSGLSQAHCGLVNVPHMRDVYAVYHSTEHHFSGLIRTSDSVELAMSSVPKELEPIGLMAYNRDGFSTHCKDHKEYWQWVTKRNPARYASTVAHGKNYDAKNMMHTFRLLAMAEEIGRTGEILVERAEREELLAIKRGEFAYDELVARAEKQLSVIEDVYKRSALQAVPKTEVAASILVQIREATLS